MSTYSNQIYDSEANNKEISHSLEFFDKVKVMTSNIWVILMEQNVKTFWQMTPIANQQAYPKHSYLFEHFALISSWLIDEF